MNMKDLLKEGLVRVVFVKQNDEEREMFCSLNSAYLPEQKKTDGDTDKPKRKPNPDVTVVYDVVKRGWRSMKNDSVVSFDAVDHRDERLSEAFIAYIESDSE